MYLLYLDESGDSKLGSGSNFLVVGGAAIIDGRWPQLERDIHGLINSYFPGPQKPKELHLNEIRSGRNHFRQLPKLKRAELEADFCNVATSMLSNEAAFFAVVADKHIWARDHPGKTGEDLFTEMFEQISARFDFFLRRRYAEGSAQKGIIISDVGKGSVMKAVRDNHQLFRQSGTQWNPIYNLIETVFFLNSEDSPGLQLADLCTYSIWRLITANDDSIARQIFRCFDREPPTSRVSPGKWHGIKLITDEPQLRNQLKKVWTDKP